LAEQRWANIPDINVHFEISTEECRRMHESKTFKDKRGGKHILKINAENVVKFTSHGTIYTDDWNEFCQGEDVIENGVVETKLVSMEVISITLRSNVSIRFTKDKSMGEDLDADMEIACSANMNGCDASTVTYSWKAPLETCNMVVEKNPRVLG
jgi:hypothetical protein